MKKNYLKTNLISFIVGVLIFSCIGVYAIVNFSSNDVTYDNKESGLSSTNVKGAIDELYTECTKEPTAGETIIENAGLEKDPYECRYFFTGANPNNYITFNNEKAGWRIISVECDGTIKIVKNNSIGEMAWDSSNSNNWAKPASLNSYLNGTYYNGLGSIAKEQIEMKDFSIGSVEQSKIISLEQQINEENSIKWNGKIAIPTTSEYIRVNSNKTLCASFLAYYCSNPQIQCRDTNWMYNGNYWWTLNIITGTNNPHHISGSSDCFNGGNSSNWYRFEVYPTLYLSSNIKITGGTGTSSDPYQISL